MDNSFTIKKIFKMILPEEIYIGITGLGLLYFFASFYVYSATKGYVNPRIKAKMSNSRFIEEVDDNRRLRFCAVKEKDGDLELNNRRHTITSGCTLRNVDGPVIQVHKDVARTLTPEYIQSSNNLFRAGFKTFAHAMELYKQEYFKQDWSEARAAIDAKPAMASVITDGVEKKIGIELMKPLQQDNFTQDLSIVNNFNNSKMSPMGLKNVIEKVKIEAERNHNDGFTVEKAMKWVAVIAALMCATAFALILANAAGLKLFGGTPTPQQVVEVVSNVSNMTK
jgi:hypothetical protein